MPRFSFPTLLVVAALGLQMAAAQTPNTPAAPAVVAEALKRPRVVVLDVRTPTEYAAGHLRAAQNLDFRAPGFREKIAQLDKRNTYVLYCASGNRSGQATALMQELGFRNVLNAGGLRALQESGIK